MLLGLGNRSALRESCPNVRSGLPEADSRTPTYVLAILIAFPAGAHNMWHPRR